MFITHKTELDIDLNSITYKKLKRYFNLRRIIFNLALKEVYKDFPKDKLCNERFKPKELTRQYFTTVRNNLRKDGKSSKFIKLFNGSALNRVVQNDLSEAFFAKWDARKTGLPRSLRSKSKNSVTFERQTVSSFNGSGNDCIKLPNIGVIKLKEKLRWEYSDNIKILTIKEENGVLYACITMDVPVEQLHITGKKVGIDWGIKTFLTLSDGNTVEVNKKKVFSLDYKINKLNKALSKKKLKSKNYKKCRSKLNKAHKKKWNYIKDIVHKTTKSLVTEYDKICIEDFKMKFMIKNKRLAKSAIQNLYYTFKVQLEYKCKLYGKELILASNTFPSTQTCSNCGNVLSGSEKLTLKDRTYECKCCGLSLDRDVNASINLCNLIIN